MTPMPTSGELSRFRDLVTGLMGLNASELKLSRLDELLRRRAQANKMQCSAYLDALGKDQIQATELAQLVQELTITETYFFRNPAHYAALTEAALPERLAALSGRQQVHILSAGCASGEEAYSLAILVKEHFPDAAHLIAITAIDFNPAVLEKAQQARYSSWSLRDMAPDRQARWFRSEGNAFLLDQNVRQAVKFERHNLAAENPAFWWEGRFDIVFCRNVLMYFVLEQAQAALRRIAFSMMPGAYLFMGHAETLRGLSNDFHLCHTHETFYYQRKPLPLSSELPERRIAATPSRWQEVSLASNTSWIETIQAASERIQHIAGGAQKNAGDERLHAAAPALNLEHAMEYLHQERYDSVLQQIGSLPEEHAQDTDVLLLKAVSLCHSGASEAAEGVCQQLLQHDELNAGAHYVLALCRESAGNMQDAVDHDQMASYLDPAFAMPRLHMGLLTNRNGDKATAMTALNQALLLLQQEDPSRILLFGGGFKREALIALCRSQLNATGARP